MDLVRARHLDPFKPVLLSATSTPLVVNDERSTYIRAILDKACSDSRFAQKAYDSILLVLTAGQTLPPVVTSLSPNNAKIGDQTFDIHVMGTGFNSHSRIIFAGQVEPTTLVSPTELTTGVNMDMWLGPDVLPVQVQDSSTGVVSNSMDFTFNPADPTTLSTTTSTAGVKPVSGQTNQVAGKK
jgi:hypothetical protein